MPRGKKTSPEIIYRIMNSWAVTDNYKETARDLNIPVTTVKSVVDRNKNKAEFVKLCNEKREEFSKTADRIIRKATAKLEYELDNSEYIPVNHLTTVIGTLYDKKALADGTATENVAISIKLPPGAEEYAE